jgi:type IV secretory pathway TrbD component
VAQILKTGILYFAFVFGVGFVLGSIRVLWAVQHFGARMAELMETPIMFLVTIGAARWLVRRLTVPYTLFSRLGIGCVALSLLLVAEFTIVLWLRGLSISEYFASRDPVSGTVYYVMLGVFAIMPLLVARR